MAATAAALRLQLAMSHAHSLAMENMEHFFGSDALVKETKGNKNSQTPTIKLTVDLPCC